MRKPSKRQTQPVNDPWLPDCNKVAHLRALIAQHKQIAETDLRMLRLKQLVRSLEAERYAAAPSEQFPFRLKEALDLARDIVKAPYTRTGVLSHGGGPKGAAKTNAIKRDDVESRIKQAANLYIHFSEQYPQWAADVVNEQIREKLQVSRRTLDEYLAKARKKKLIPSRHRRSR